MSMRGKTQSAETKAKIAETLRARMNDPAVRAKISAATKARMADPAVRQRIRDGMAAAAGDLVSLTVLRAAWRGAPPSVRRAFIIELLGPLFDGPVCGPSQIEPGASPSETPAET